MDAPRAVLVGRGCAPTPLGSWIPGSSLSRPTPYYFSVRAIKEILPPASACSPPTGDVVPLSQHLPVAINPRPWAKRCTSGGASLPVEPRSSYSSLGSLSAASFSRRFAPDADLCGTRHVGEFTTAPTPRKARARTRCPSARRQPAALTPCCLLRAAVQLAGHGVRRPHDSVNALTMLDVCGARHPSDALRRHHRRRQLRQQPPAAAALNACGICLLHCASSRLCGTRFCCAGVC